MNGHFNYASADYGDYFVLQTKLGSLSNLRILIDENQSRDNEKSGDYFGGFVLLEVHSIGMIKRNKQY